VDTVRRKKKEEKLGIKEDKAKGAEEAH